MNRRSFLKRAATAVAIAAVAPVAFEGAIFPEADLVVSPIDTTIGSYYDYMNFSSFAIAESLDKAYASAAEELGRRAGESINQLYQTVYDS